jgi:hypothetical protein
MKDDELGRLRVDEKFVQNFSRKIWKEQTKWETGSIHGGSSMHKASWCGLKSADSE